MGGRVERAFAVIQPGLELVLADELTGLGIENQLTEGGVTFEASPGALYQVHFLARTPTRVWVRLGQFPAVTLDALARGVVRLPWSRYLHRRQNLNIRVTTHDSRLRFRDRISKKVEHAVRDAFRTPGPGIAGRGRPPRHPALLNVRVVRDRAEVSVDASGEALYRRGWRQHVGDAPLRENLAAAVLHMVEWHPSEPLVDPMCGSGTFCVEAATIAAGRAPGQGRSFAFESWPTHDAEAWQRQRRVALEVHPPPSIYGSDRDERPLQAARANARRASVGPLVQFRHLDVAELDPPTEMPGLVVANPPWGDRLSGAPAAWRALGITLRQRFGGWRVALLAPTAGLIRRTGLRLERVAQFKAGGTRISLYTGSVPH